MPVRTGHRLGLGCSRQRDAAGALVSDSSDDVDVPTEPRQRLAGIDRGAASRAGRRRSVFGLVGRFRKNDGCGGQALERHTLRLADSGVGRGHHRADCCCRGCGPHSAVSEHSVSDRRSFCRCHPGVHRGNGRCSATERTAVAAVNHHITDVPTASIAARIARPIIPSLSEHWAPQTHETGI